MKDYKFYQFYANMPLGERYKLLSNDYTSPVLGMTLDSVYKEIKDIDDKIREDLIRKEKLLSAIEWIFITNKN